MNLAKRNNGIYYIQYFDSEEKKIKRVSTSKRNKKEALLFLFEFNKIIKSKTQLTSSSLCDIREEYIRYIGNAYSKKYLSSVKLSFRQLLKKIDDTSLDKIIVRQVQEFLSETFKRTERGAELYLRTLKAAFNRAVDWGYIEDNPFKKVKLPKSQKPFPVFITVSELNYIPDHTKNIELRFLYCCTLYWDET